MTEPKPEVLTSTHNSLTQRGAGSVWTHAQKLAYRLQQACLGRENHAALFSLSAERDPATGDTLLLWTDDFTGQTGRLGSLEPAEVAVIVGALFAQLRGWRMRCESGPARAAAAGGAR